MVSARALSSLSASAHGEREIVNERWVSQLVTAPTAHALLRLPPPHGSAVGSEAIPGTPLLATAHFRSRRMAALKTVAVGEAMEEEGS
jgi:hypothetical protein